MPLTMYRISGSGPDLAPPAPPPPARGVRRWYRFLSRYIATEQEKARWDDGLDAKCLLFTINLQHIFFCGSTLCIFPFLPWADVWILYYTLAALFLTVTAASLVHMLVTKRAWLCHFATTWWLQLITAATFWSFGGVLAGSGFLLLPFLAPYISFIVDYEYRRGPMYMFAFATVLVVARAVVDLALGPGALTPLVIRIPDTGMVMASVATTVGTTFIAFSASLTMLRKLHQRAEALQCSMKEATSMAQCIVNFDLDDLPKPSSHSGIVDLMVQVAEKLRLYRPYLPAHVFASGEGDQEASDLDELMTVSARSCGGAPSKVSSPAQRRKTASTSSVPTGRQLVCVTRHHPTLAHRGLEANNGTLLSVRITQVDEGDASLGSTSYTIVERVADIFARLVADAAKETKGMLQAVSQSHCLILWNVFPRCPLHVGQALAAALAIRDGFKQQCAAAELPDLTVAMGLWSGAFVSGTITFGDMMSYACLGQGPERAEALQAYAALSGRGIVCSSRVFDATKAAPKQRLVPVDVLTFSPKDLCGEIVYECVGEIQTDHDEWMYQLNANETSFVDDAELARLLQQIQDGKIANSAEFDRHVNRLKDSADAVVARAARGLRAMAHQHSTAGRYSRELRSVWPPEQCHGAQTARGWTAPWPQFLTCK